MISARDGWGVNALRARMLPRATTALVGMSGVGKSTLVNLLLGEERQKTLEVREDDARGRHATSHRELFMLDDGALVLDTPGLRLPRMARPTASRTRSRTWPRRRPGAGSPTAATTASRAARCRRRSRRASWTRSRLEAMRKLEREGLSAAERRERSRAFTRRYRDEIRARTGGDEISRAGARRRVGPGRAGRSRGRRAG